jgi:hypothetical protein
MGFKNRRPWNKQTERAVNKRTSRDYFFKTMSNDMIESNKIGFVCSILMGYFLIQNGEMP